MDYSKTEETPINEEQGSTNSSESRSNEELFSDCDQQHSSIANEFGLTELPKDDKVYELIYRHCQSKLTSHLSNQFEIVSILKNGFQTPLGQAKLKAFQIYAESVAKKSGSCCGNKAAVAEAARVKYGCCGVEKEELKAILMYGFSNNALCLSPDNAPLQCMIDPSSSCNEDGISFLLFSRIIMGKSEVVCSTSQSYPSSMEFDSGVDSLTSPNKYIIWSTHMNTHVLPEFVVCIKTPSILKRIADLVCLFDIENPKSPWISFPVLINSISKFLNQSQIRLIHKHYKEHQDRRISRCELIQRLRSITGDSLLVQIIKSVGQKVHKDT
ncbi:putative protein [Arabidopsis thaliana]|nr:putative protein [Arabidopsis thaliana]